MVQRDSGLHINNTWEEPFEIQGIKEVDVYKEVANINIKKSSGFPNINSRVLKEAFKAVIPELTAILNLSIKSTTFPDSWKLATAIPIPKKGDLCQVENYRPISLLPLPGKLLERVVHVQLEKELEESGFYTDYQYGFRKNRSTTHATLQLVNHINYKMDKNIPTAAIFIDFKKAFDCVNHQTLIDKLETTNFGIDTINWIKDYLSNRQQCVMANNLKSSTKRIKQGVPQGSTLGPLFYIIYANDMPKCIRSNISLYADDTVIYHSSRDGTHLMLKLQEDMDRLQQWCYKNKLTINTNKTKMMVFGRKGCREKLNEVKIRYGNTRIEEVTQYNYLGINLDQTLKYDNHAKAIIQRASDKIRYLKRIRKFITSAAALNIYKNMILPIFEYGDILLVSASATLRKRMQILQNKALKCALGLDPTTGSDEVHRLAKLEKLSDRRDLHLTQIMFRQKENPFLWKRKKRRTSGVTTRSGRKKQFVIPRAKTEKFKKSITIKAPTAWNSLPESMQKIQDLRLFKFSLKKHILEAGKKSKSKSKTKTNEKTKTKTKTKERIMLKPGLSLKSKSKSKPIPKSKPKSKPKPKPKLKPKPKPKPTPKPKPKTKPKLKPKH